MDARTNAAAAKCHAAIEQTRNLQQQHRDILLRSEETLAQSRVILKSVSSVKTYYRST